MNDEEKRRMQEGFAGWEKTANDSFRKMQPRVARFSTISDEEIKALYTPLDVEAADYARDLGFPGEFPYTRGVQTTMYRARSWTMRMFAGFGSAEDTNRRYKYLLEHGENGLSVAFHLPTLMGFDSDAAVSRGEVGKCGVAVDTLRDMEILFDGIPLDQVTTSMTINSPAAILLAMYIVAAEKQGVSQDKIGGTLQNDMLKEFIAQKEFMLPPEPAVKLIVDTIEYCTRHVPRWNTISISGYHIREAGSTAVQELAFTLADGIAYVQASIERGLKVDEFAPRLSFFFNAHMDLFEEIAKYRAARRLWAKIMKDRFHARQERSLLMRFHTQTAGCSLTAQQPYNNIIRTTIEALAGVLGGTQSLHTNSMDETLALPSEEAVTIALRTQQIIAEESGVANTIDPLAGSYFIEALTTRMEQQAMEYIDRIDALGGMLKAIDLGFPQQEIAEAAYHYQLQVDRNEKIVVGVNRYVKEKEAPIEVLVIDPAVERKQIERLHRIKTERDDEAVTQALTEIRQACVENRNTMPSLIEAVRRYATLQEICDVMREVYGIYRDPGYF